MQKVVDIKFKKGGRFFTFNANGLKLSVGERLLLKLKEVWKLVKLLKVSMK